MSARQLNNRHYKYEPLMRYAKQMGFGEVHTKIDLDTGLHAMIAIHSTKLGPAIGGSRLYGYHSDGAAMKDVLQLSYMMTLKAAISDLPHGGAKAVIIKPKKIKKRDAFFEAYGDFVHSMNGRYITAIDVGTSTDDMNIIANRTPYVIGSTNLGKTDSDPSSHTALGVMKCIQAAVKFKLNKDSVEGLHVVIQGAGSVGYDLGKLLKEDGARLTVSDPDPTAIQKFVNDFNANFVDIKAIYDVPCDIFAPCALGGTVNADAVKRLSCSFLIGSANNQLAHRKIMHLLEQADILYIPDYLANSGGLIHAAMVYDYEDAKLAEVKINELYNTTLTLLERSAREKKNINAVTEEIALKKLHSKDKTKETISE